MTACCSYIGNKILDGYDGLCELVNKVPNKIKIPAFALTVLGICAGDAVLSYREYKTTLEQCQKLAEGRCHHAAHMAAFLPVYGLLTVGTILVSTVSILQRASYMRSQRRSEEAQPLV